MRRSGKGSGGGIGMNKNVRVGVRTGAGAKAVHKAGVAQLGQHTGDHITRQGSTGYRGEPLMAGAGYNPAKYGNEIAAKTVCGPGGSRNIYRTGVQGVHGATNPGKAPERRDILSEFGPESKR